MHFKKLSPFDGNCLWTINIYDCKQQSVFIFVASASCAIYGMAALMGVSLLIYRYRHVWSVETRVNSARLIRRPVDWMIVHLAWCSFARSAYTLLLAIDVIPGAAIRQLILAFTNWGYLWALAVFLAGVVEALFLVLQQTSFETNFRWCRDTNQPSSPGRGTRKFCGISLHSIMERGILMVIGLIVCVVPCTATALSYMAGQALDTENWDEYARLEQLSWLTWTAGLGCLAFLASLYLGSLSSVLRQSANLLRLSAASYDADTSQQLLWLIKLMICFYISSTLASIAHSLLFSIMLAHFYPSIAYFAFFEVIWWPCLTLIIFIVISQNRQRTPSNTFESNQSNTLPALWHSGFSRGLAQTSTQSPGMLALNRSIFSIPNSLHSEDNFSVHTWSPLIDNDTEITPILPIRTCSLPRELPPSPSVSVTVVIEKSFMDAAVNAVPKHKSVPNFF